MAKAANKIAYSCFTMRRLQEQDHPIQVQAHLLKGFPYRVIIVRTLLSDSAGPADQKTFFFSLSFFFSLKCPTFNHSKRSDAVVHSAAMALTSFWLTERGVWAVSAAWVLTRMSNVGDALEFSQGNSGVFRALRRHIPVPAVTPLPSGRVLLCGFDGLVKPWRVHYFTYLVNFISWLDPSHPNKRKY